MEARVTQGNPDALADLFREYAGAGRDGQPRRRAHRAGNREPIPKGERHAAIVAAAGLLRAYGLDAEAITAALVADLLPRFVPSFEDAPDDYGQDPAEHIADTAASVCRNYLAGDLWLFARIALAEDGLRAEDDAPPPSDIRVVSLADFAAVDEPGAEPLLGTPDEVVLPKGSTSMLYGLPGSNKTTLADDLAFHLAHSRSD